MCIVSKRCFRCKGFSVRVFACGVISGEKWNAMRSDFGGRFFFLRFVGRFGVRKCVFLIMNGLDWNE